MALGVFAFCAESSWYGDDMLFKYFIEGEYGEKEDLKTILDIIPSQLNHYISGNGRFVAHILVQLFCAFLGPTLFGICNALMYIALVILILHFIGASLQSWKAVLSIVILIILCFSTKMMPSCQIGYIWSFVIALTFIKIFFDKSLVSPWWWLPLFVFALIAGNFHEGVNFGVAGALFIWFIINFRRITASQWVMLVGFAIGALFIVLSPASRGRVASTNTPLILSIVNLLHYGIGLYVLAGAFIAVLLKNKRFKDVLKENYFFLSAVIFSLTLNLAISIGTSRQLYGMNLFCIIVALNMLSRKTLSNFWLILTGLLATLHLTVQFHDTWKMRMFTDDLNRQLATIDGLPGQTVTIFIDCYPASKCWYSPLDSYVENNSFIGDGNLLKLNIELRHRFPNKNIDILPKDLLSLDSANIDSGILNTSDGNYLIFARDGYTAPRLKAKRTIGLPETPYKKSHSNVIYDMNNASDSEIYNYNGFKAILISQWSYIPLIEIAGVEEIN